VLHTLRDGIAALHSPIMSKPRTALEQRLGREGFSLATIRFCARQRERFEHQPARKPPKLMPTHLARALKRTGDQQ
jgi:hypothetical protein